jgi:hypothetical protein
MDKAKNPQETVAKLIDSYQEYLQVMKKSLTSKDKIIELLQSDLEVCQRRIDMLASENNSLKHKSNRP